MYDFEISYPSGAAEGPRRWFYGGTEAASYRIKCKSCVTIDGAITDERLLLRWVDHKGENKDQAILPGEVIDVTSPEISVSLSGDNCKAAGTYTRLS